jgi:acetyl esterase/lipase
MRPCMAITVALLLALSLTSPATLAAWEGGDKQERPPDVRYVPTPTEVVERMLEVAKITKYDVVYDLGCGDGRIVCAAARKYGCKAIGYDIDPNRIKDSEKNREKETMEVQKLISFERKDIFKLDLSKATVIMLYLRPELNVKLIPQLKRLGPAARIVSHSWDMRGVVPDKGFPIEVKKKDGFRRLVYRWTTPLKLEEEVDDAPFTKKTFTFKTVDRLEIKADVHRAGDTVARPVVVWIHGGALIVGSRVGVPRNLLELCRKEGYVLVSLDYRLAPEVKLPAIIEDIKDAFTWLREKGPALCYIDPDRIVVTGGSAGGYLTLMTGIVVAPRPRALVAYWGYGDVDGEWYTKPSAHYRKTVALITRDEAEKAVGGKVLAGTEGAEGRLRGRFYLYLRQNGSWTSRVTGFDPQTQRAKLDPYCPVRNVTRDYPPTMLVHGTEDTDVPYELSAAMAKELNRNKVKHELVTVRGAGHGLSGGDARANAAAHEKALEFIRGYLRDEKGSR